MKKKDIYKNYKKEIVSLRKDIIYDFNKLNNADKVSLKYKVEPKTPLEKNIKSFVDNFIKVRIEEENGRSIKYQKEFINYVKEEIRKQNYTLKPNKTSIVFIM